MIRINPKYSKKATYSARLVSETILKSIPIAATEAVNRFAHPSDDNFTNIECIEGIIPISKDLKQKIVSESGKNFVSNKEGFVIVFDGRKVEIYSESEIGIQNGVMTFLQSLDEQGCYCDEIIWDHPICSFRGIKVMMPARGEIEDFKKFVDMMTFFRHNTLMIEIGGAMEYKCHPEINVGWEEYCEFMFEYSGKTKKLQEFTYPWRKNSIHCNNGGGSYLTQDEIRDIVNYCKSRNVTIIPEVPSTSHCDYMLIKHHELAERCEDPYPDTFCPSNPASYELLFDIIDEVIDVFQPEIINIGHDEYYSINICDRCRKRIISNSELLAEDINKIHDYLALKNVKTMLWCDMLMNVEEQEGRGGALSYVYFAWNPKNELLNIIRPTWEARNKLPKDIIFMNWFMSFGEKYDEEIRDFPVVFGNFSGQIDFRNFGHRVGKNTFGGMCSNWGANTDVYFQRNNVYSSLAYNEIYYWDNSYDDNNDSEYSDRIDRMYRSLYEYRYCEWLIKGHAIEVVHTTDKFVWYREFTDGIFPDGEEFRKQYLVGQYKIEYTDDTVEFEDVFYGQHIINKDVPWYRTSNCVESANIDANPGAQSLRIDRGLSSMGGMTIPIYEDGKIYCKYIIPNRHPNKSIKNITFILPKEAEWNIDIKSIKIF